jgi:hypothetical protein
MPLAPLAPVARQRNLLTTNVLAAGGRLYTYEAGTTVPLTTYSDSALSVANANPVLCDAAGLLPPVYLLSQSYKFRFTDAADVLLWEQDDVTDSGAVLNVAMTALDDTAAALAAMTQTKFCTTQFDAVTGTTGATLTNLTGLTAFSLAAGGVYKFDISIAGTSTANSGLKLGFGLTTATLTNNEATSTGFTASSLVTQHTTTATTGMTLFGATGAYIHVRITGRLTVNVAGTLSIQGAQNVAHADMTSVFTGSWATFTKIS